MLGAKHSVPEIGDIFTPQHTRLNAFLKWILLLSMYAKSNS